MPGVVAATLLAATPPSHHQAARHPSGAQQLLRHTPRAGSDRVRQPAPLVQRHWPARRRRRRTGGAAAQQQAAAAGGAAEAEASVGEGAEDEYLELPEEPQHIVLEQDFLDAAPELRAHFDARFGDVRRTSSDRFCWDYWCARAACKSCCWGWPQPRLGAWRCGAARTQRACRPPGCCAGTSRASTRCCARRQSPSSRDSSTRAWRTRSQSTGSGSWGAGASPPSGSGGGPGVRQRPPTEAA